MIPATPSPCKVLRTWLAAAPTVLRKAAHQVIDVRRVQRYSLLWGQEHDDHQQQDRMDRRTDMGFLDPPYEAGEACR
jgi:hypothetical protein